MRSPLQMPKFSSAFVSGDVSIDPHAVIAPGAVLQASPGSQIIIAPGACIGMGCVLVAHNGVMEVETGVNIGTRVLLWGVVKIGAYACIGSEATIVDSSIESNAVVPAQSLVGDSSRQPPSPTETVSSFVGPGTQVKTEFKSEFKTEFKTEFKAELNTSPEPEPPIPDDPAEQPPESSTALTRPQVYGKANLHQLLDALLPHRRVFQASQDNNPPSD